MIAAVQFLCVLVVGESSLNAGITAELPGAALGMKLHLYMALAIFPLPRTK